MKTNIEYPISLLELQTRLLFKSGVMSFIAYSRFNYSLQDLKFKSFKDIAKSRQYNYASSVVSRMKLNKNSTTNYFSITELKELENLFIKEYNNIIEQNKQAIFFI